MFTERISAILTDPKLWPGEAAASVALQRRLAAQVRTEPFTVEGVGLVAGLDVCYAKDDSRLWAAAVVLDATTWECVESIVVEDIPGYEYVPGLFAFRELPALLAAVARLTVRPEVFLCDGVGRAHPRRFGLASHLGVLLDVPSVGSAKTRLFGAHGEVGSVRGSWAPLMASGDMVPARQEVTSLRAEDGREEIGRVLRTRDGTKPVYVSEGHRVDLDSAAELLLRATPRFRIPEPIRAADHACGQARRAALGE